MDPPGDVPRRLLQALSGQRRLGKHFELQRQRVSTGTGNAAAISRKDGAGPCWGFLVLVTALNGACFLVFAGAVKLWGERSPASGAVMPFVLKSVETAVTAALAAASATALYVGLAQAVESETAA